MINKPLTHFTRVLLHHGNILSVYQCDNYCHIDQDNCCHIDRTIQEVLDISFWSILQSFSRPFCFSQSCTRKVSFPLNSSNQILIVFHDRRKKFLRWMPKIPWDREVMERKPHISYKSIGIKNILYINI